MRNRGITTIILAGGAATRMRPLSNSVTKAMISFAGRPLLDHLLAQLHDQGFDDVVMTTSGAKGEIRARFGDGRDLGMDIRYSDSGRWQGTASCARSALDGLSVDAGQPVMVIYGDSLLQTDFRAMLAAHRRTGAAATILCHRPDFAAFLYEGHDLAEESRGPELRTNFGVVEAVEDGRIARFVEKPALSDVAGFVHPVANATVYLLEDSVWAWLPACGPCDFARDLFPALLGAGLDLRAWDIGGGYRLDIGTLRTYYAAQMAVLEGRLMIDAAVPASGEGLRVSPRAKVDSLARVAAPAMVGPGSRIGAGAVVSSSIIGERVEIGAGARITGSIVLDGTRIEAGVEVSRCILAEGCLVGTGTRLPEGSALGASVAAVSFDPDMTPSEFDRLLRA